MIRIGLLHRLRRWLYPEWAWRAYLVARERREGRPRPPGPQERNEALTDALRGQSEVRDELREVQEQLRRKRERSEAAIRHFLPPRGGDLRRSLLGGDRSRHVPGANGESVCVATMGQTCTICEQNRRVSRAMAVPSGILTVPGTLDEEEARRLKEEWLKIVNGHAEHDGPIHPGDMGVTFLVNATLEALTPDQQYRRNLLALRPDPGRWEKR